MVVGLVLAGCVAVTGVHFATAQQDQAGGAQNKAESGGEQSGAQQQNQGAQEQQQGAQQNQGQKGRRDGIQRPDRGDKGAVRQDRSRTRAGSKQRTNVQSSSSTQIIRSSLVMGAPVTLHGGASLGTVQEFVIGEGGCVDYMIVSYDNRLVPVPWSVATFQAEDRVIMLDIEEAQLAQVPVITDFAELQNTEFVTKVNTFYKTEERSRERSSTGSNRDGKSRRDGKAGKSDRGSQNRDAQNKAGSRPAEKNRGADSKKSDAQKGDTQKSDAKKGDSQKSDAPKADAPKADAPKADAPKTDAKKSDEKAPETPAKQ
jgi:hypothetical protein